MILATFFAVVAGIAIGMGIYIDLRRRRTFRLPPIEDDPRFEPAPGYERDPLEPWLDAFADNKPDGDRYFGPHGGETVGHRKRRSEIREWGARR